MKYPFALILLLSCLCGCTSVTVQPLTTKYKVEKVLIKTNPKVEVDDFLDVLVAGFERHGIATKIVDDSADTKEAFVVTYVAYRQWDMAPYLVRATITIDKDGQRVAQAEYHLRAGGGFSLMKWQGTQAKINPVIDQLVARPIPGLGVKP